MFDAVGASRPETVVHVKSAESALRRFFMLKVRIAESLIERGLARFTDETQTYYRYTICDTAKFQLTLIDTTLEKLMKFEYRAPKDL